MLPFDSYASAAAASLMSTSPLGFSLADRIAVLNAADAALQLDDVQDKRILPGGEDPIGPPYPVIEIDVPDFELTGFSLEQQAGDLLTSVALRVWLQHPIYQRLRARMFATTTAVVETLAQRDAFGPSVIVRQVRGAFGLNPETGTRQEITGSTVLVFTLEDAYQAPM